MCPDFYIKTHKVFWHFLPDMVLKFLLLRSATFFFFLSQCDALKAASRAFQVLWYVLFPPAHGGNVVL